MAGIRVDGHRNALSHPFHVCLDGIVPAGRHFGALHRGDEHPAELALAEELLLLVGHVPGVGAAGLEGGAVVALHGAGPLHHVSDEGGDGFLVGEILFLLGGEFRHVDGGRVRLPVPGGLEEVAERPDEGGFPHELLLGVGEFHLRFDGSPALRRDGLMVADEEEACDLMDGEASGEVFRALCRREPPVLVGIQRTVPVHVLEYFAICLDGRHARRGTVPENGTVLLCDSDEIPVGNLTWTAGDGEGKEKGRDDDPEWAVEVCHGQCLKLKRMSAGILSRPRFMRSAS